MFRKQHYLSKSHTVSLIGSLLSLGSIHQLEACFILLMEISILTATSKLRRVFIYTEQNNNNFD